MTGYSHFGNYEQHLPLKSCSESSVLEGRADYVVDPFTGCLVFLKQDFPKVTLCYNTRHAVVPDCPESVIDFHCRGEDVTRVNGG